MIRKQYETVQKRMHKTYNVSVSKHLRGTKKVVGYSFLPKNFLPNFICPLIRIDYTSPPQSCQAALRVPEPILTAKMFKKI